MDAKILPLGYAAIINHSSDPAIQNCRIEAIPGLAKRSPHAGQIVYKFLRDIQPDEELIGNYGPNIDKEIQKISESSNFLTANSEELAKFLEYNLYNLSDIVKSLSDL